MLSGLTTGRYVFLELVFNGPSGVYLFFSSGAVDLMNVELM